MDKNTITGFILIAGIILGMQYFNSPSDAEMARQEFLQDSIKQEQLRVDSIAEAKKDGIEAPIIETVENVLPDSVKVANRAGKFGAFAPSASGENKEVTIENDLLKVTFSTKGGRITDVLLKEYEKWSKDSLGDVSIKEPLHLWEDKKNKFEYLIPINGANRSKILTSELYFDADVKGNAVTLRASAGDGKYIEQKYSLEDGKYMLEYDLNLVGLNQIIPSDAEKIELRWDNYLDKVELNAEYEAMYTSAYYKQAEEDPDHCSCTADDEQTKEKVQWVSHTQQFFNSTLIADKNFLNAKIETVLTEEDSENLKKLTTRASLPYDADGTSNYDMQIYIGPNDFDRLRAYDMDMEEIIPFGWGIFRSVNKYLIRPTFKFLSSFIGNMGIVILLLTFIVKLLVYPLTYKMLHSQAKMQSLKPDLEKLRKKHGDDKQAIQMKTMEMYRASGVNPLGGCWPMALQMPIWYALFRFFPGSIDFRQQSFLWAHDLSTYDSILNLTSSIPFYGDHVSLFTLLWAGTTVIYSYYNMQNMQMPTQEGMNANMMKYMQYLMPVMFLFFFNSYAAGLTVYMLFSNVFNIAQTIITKNFVINHDKVANKLEANRKKPKKKGGFGERLQNALAEQQKVQENQQANKANKKKK
ncbi:MAG: YidC/Oxa1 family membrane protein insertase [Cognaticolwellia sp.]|jgi:YidC/Oxa1 family membrane protein insertase